MEHRKLIQFIAACCALIGTWAISHKARGSGQAGSSEGDSAVAAAPLGAADPQRVQSVLDGLSLKEKVGQVVVSYPPLDRQGPVQVGGVVLVGNLLKSADEVRARVDDLQSRSAIPLLVAADVEGGELNRLAFLPELEQLPSARELGRGRAADAQAWALRVGQGMRSLGINVSLAPVLDLSGSGLMYESGRSFGSDPERVVSVAGAYIQGLVQSGVAPIGKHFPGYGDLAANTDYHLLVRQVSREQLEQEIAVFEQLRSSLAGVMVGNVGYSGYGATPAIITSELVQRAHDNGWPTVTDDLAIGTLAEATGGDPEQLFLQAFRAGNDVLLTTAPPDWDKGLDYLGLLEGLMLEEPALQEELDERVRRVLTLKDRLGLLEGLDQAR